MYKHIKASIPQPFRAHHVKVVGIIVTFHGSAPILLIRETFITLVTACVLCLISTFQLLYVIALTTKFEGVIECLDIINMSAFFHSDFPPSFCTIMTVQDTISGRKKPPD